MILYVILEEGDTSAAALYTVMDSLVLGMNLPLHLGEKQVLPSIQVRT